MVRIIVFFTIVFSIPSLFATENFNSEISSSELELVIETLGLEQELALGRRCSSDGWCPSGHSCIRGRCVNTSECSSDGHCPFPESCIGGTCVNTRECSSDGHCPGTKVCRGGACVERW